MEKTKKLVLSCIHCDGILSKRTSAKMWSPGPTICWRMCLRPACAWSLSVPLLIPATQITRLEWQSSLADDPLPALLLLLPPIPLKLLLILEHPACCSSSNVQLVLSNEPWDKVGVSCCWVASTGITIDLLFFLLLLLQHYYHMIPSGFE